MNFVKQFQLLIVTACALLVPVHAHAMLSGIRKATQPALRTTHQAAYNPFEVAEVSIKTATEAYALDHAQYLETINRGLRDSLKAQARENTQLALKIASLQRQRVGLSVSLAITSGMLITQIYGKEIQELQTSIEKMPITVAEYICEKKRIAKNKILTTINTGKHAAKEFIGEDLALEQAVKPVTYLTTHEPFIFNATPAQRTQRIQWHTLNWN